MARNFKELRAKMTPQAQAESARKANDILRSMSLHELRKESRRTQSQVAEGMGVGQGTISKIEQNSNISLGTLQSYVEELGGELEVRAKFPSHSVILTVAKEA
ncbi:MAG: helix-turn-helix transcriptional regulator [Terriglobus sp.]